MTRGDKTPSWFLIVAATLVTTACASAPTGPSVMVLPGSGKSDDQFRAEDARCRQRAASEVQTTDHGTVTAQGRYDMVYMQCMYAQDNQIPVPGRGWRSTETDAPTTTRSPVLPPPPPGAPPPPPPGPAR
jgi:hypothetical protein